MLWLHIAAGAMAWLVGVIALWLSITGRRSRDGLAAFHWSVLAVAVTASILVAFRPAQLWWLWLLAALSYGLALLGHLAPREQSPGWLRLGIHGQGGAFIALVTATFVVSVHGWAQILAWTLPTLVGAPLLDCGTAGPKQLNPRRGRGWSSSKPGLWQAPGPWSDCAGVDNPFPEAHHRHADDAKLSRPVCCDCRVSASAVGAAPAACRAPRHRTQRLRVDPCRDLRQSSAVLQLTLLTDQAAEHS